MKQRFSRNKFFPVQYLVIYMSLFLHRKYFLLVLRHVPGRIINNNILSNMPLQLFLIMEGSQSITAKEIIEIFIKIVRESEHMLHIKRLVSVRQSFQVN